jgi:hypothetical protein
VCCCALAQLAPTPVPSTNFTLPAFLIFTTRFAHVSDSKAGGGGSRDFLLLDHKYAEDCPGMHSENIVVDGLELWKAKPGSVVTVCPAAASPLLPQTPFANVGTSPNAKAFSDNMAALKRGTPLPSSSFPLVCPPPSSPFNQRTFLRLALGCLDFHIHNKRDCAGSDEEKRGERGVFASLQGPPGILSVGDVATMKPA